MPDLSSGSVLLRRLPLVALVFSTALNITLATQVHAVKSAKAPINEPKVGTTVAPFEGSTPAGAPISIDFRQAVPTILYHFSPTCAWCERNWENVRTLVEGTKGRYRLVAISQKAVTLSFVRDHSLEIEIATNIDPGVAQRLSLGGTPQTILVSTTGTVLRSWTGAYVGHQLDDIKKFFGVSLPGLRAVEARR